MGLFNPSFLLGLVVLLYLSSFVVFAILRIATGISIQRIGYFSLRRIAYIPRDGIRIDIRGFGVHLHRPTFAQPTWISLRLTELKLTVNVKALGAGGKESSSQHGGNAPHSTYNAGRSQSSSSASPKPILRHTSPRTSRSRAWRQLTQMKERIKRLHEKIHWLRMVDVSAMNSSLVIQDIGYFQVGTFSVLVDTRRRTVDRGRLFQHKKIPAGDQRPAEWIFTIKGVLFTPEGKDSLEVVDICTLNIHGLLYKDRAGLRDTSIALKLGRIHIPYDDVLECSKSFNNHHKSSRLGRTNPPNDDDISVIDVMDELDRPGSREAKIVQTVSDSKEFVASILRGIQEIQMAVSFVGMTKEIHSIQASGSPMYLNIAMNEFGIDMHRLDPKSPAHRMYFSSKDIAHQALLAAISIAVSLDDGQGKRKRILYVPMATTTVKTTLPSKTVAFSEDKNVAERNANILFANLVVTSPSIDVSPKHLPVMLALVNSRLGTMNSSPSVQTRPHHLLSRLLPKANIKISVHEPVIRVVLPPADLKLKSTDDYDLLILSISSISLDTESSHSTAGELHYSLTSNLRIASNELYYHTASAERHNLLITEAIELKVHLNASPEVTVIATGNLQTFSIHMVRAEISAGVRQIMQQLRKGRDTKTVATTHTRHVDFLRPLPPWLVQFSLRGSNFGVEVAGVDGGLSNDTRGVALQLESWTAEYKIQRSASDEIPPFRRLGSTKSAILDEPVIKVTPPPGTNDVTPISTDGRRLAIHIRGFEGFVVDGIDSVESESFVSLPRFEVAFSTSSDKQGPVFHINSHTKALYVQYSLYRYYAIGVATTVFRKAFTSDWRPSSSPADNFGDQPGFEVSAPPSSPHRRHQHELITIDVKAEMLQVKAKMPADPPLLLHIYRLEAGRHRWAMPFMKSHLVRLYAQAPQIRSAWARIFSTKNLRLDLRENRRKRGATISQEKSIDVVTDFIRIGIPHQLVLHKIMDNFVNAMKATEQMNHRFKTDSNEYILKTRPEQPKIVPRISIRSKALLFDVEDGPFDWKLGTIYRIGLMEQKQRIAREEAFEAKCKNLGSRDHNRGSSRYRTQARPQPQRARSKQLQPQENRGRSGSVESHSRPRSESPQTRLPRRMRYDPDGKCKLTAEAKVTIAQARDRLNRHNAESWKKRIDGAYRIQSIGMRKIRGIFWGNDEVPEVDDGSEDILAMPERAGLMSALISDLHVIADKPSFPIKEYPKFLHRVGKGMPYDMEYSLLIPLSVQIDMGEARVTLRDYPLPLLHVPAIKPSQSPRLPSWSLKTDFVIAEEYRGDVSTKLVKVEVIPPEKSAELETPNGFAVDVRRTVSPVKTYSDVAIAINTSAPTSITWGTSYQPAIQEMMMVMETFTKPQIDPSERTGFWDKIRLSTHSHVNVVWKGDGDVRLQLKGARDPYVVTGSGAGFVMCWRNNVRWGIHQSDDPKKFMTVHSDEYVLAIPDYGHQAREHSTAFGRDGDSSSTSSKRNTTIFKKVIMKLSGNVQWLAGLVFERDLDRGGRSFEFTPHYDVTLRTLEHAKPLPGQVYDAFRGFRSNHIHLSVAVAAPLDRDWTTKNVKPSMSYNAVHMTPRFFTHFFDWWSLFSGVMSLPIRQGKLFPGIEKSTKKFGRHLATIKYNLLLSPLFIAHIYKHKDVEDYSEDLVSATGLKLRIDSFMLDLHQRREEFAAQGKGKAKQMKTSGMRINQAQLDFISADIRAVSASIAGTNAEDVKRATAENLPAYQEDVPPADISRFTIPDNDFSWIDMDDFVEIDWILPSETNPETKILPLAFAPHFTYFRQTDHYGSSGNTKGSHFGDEPTHFCVMSQENDPRKVQCQLIAERLAKLDEQLEIHERTLGEQELRVVRDSNRDSSLKERYELLSEQGARLQSKKKFLRRLLARLQQAVEEGRPWVSAAGDTAGFYLSEDLSESEEEEAQAQALEAAPLEPGSINDFNNRFIVHNAQVKWNNSLRNIILRYVHQVSQRRGFVYYMSQKAVKFIDDIVKEQKKSRRKHEEPDDFSATSASSSPPTVSEEEASKDDSSFEDMINDLLNDKKKVVDANDPKQTSGPGMSSTGNLGKDISKEFTPQNAYHVRLVAPQIQLQSEKNPKSVLLITAKSMQLKVVQIMDKDRIADDVSGLVQRRFSVNMDSVQFFVTSQRILMQFLHIYSGNRYGAPKNSAWPPWVAFEVNFDFAHDPFGWSRVVQRTSASLRYDKYNTLRLKYNDEVSSGKIGQKHNPENMESRIDHLWVDFPQLRATCDSTQYYTMYLIVLDLLLYSEPLEKVRSERLEKIMLASDFSDLNGASDMVVCLQARIRQLEEIKMQLQVHAKYLERQGWEDRLAIERDLANCEDELFFMMKAITTSQRKNEDRTQSSQSTALLQWYLSASEVVWHLMKDKNDPLMEIQLMKATYHRTDNSDGSNRNVVEIERMHGLNLLPNAIYPEMLGPYLESGRRFVHEQDLKMLKISWHSLEAIAGIPVLDQFEVDLFPLKVQLEREIGQKLFEYIFPGGMDKNGTNKSPFMVKHILPGADDDEDSDEENTTGVIEAARQDANGSSEEQPPTRPASLDMRLRPTMAFSEKEGHSSSANRFKHFGPTSNGETHHLRFFHHSNQSSHSQTPSRPLPSLKSSTLKEPSSESLARQPKLGSSTSLSTMNGKPEKHKRFTLNRTNSAATTTDKEKKETPSDDLSQMLSRASNYMTLAYVKIPSVILCLSYKGKGERNIEDVHNFVFKMPILEYRNKTWSNLDLALRLKKDVIKALISHTGAIIGNKFSHHRPSKQHHNRLSELASSSSLLPNTNNIENTTSETSSLRDVSGGDRADSSRDSLFSDNQLARTDSFPSSLRRPVSNNGVHSEPPSILESEGEGDDSTLKTMRQNFVRRFTSETQKLRRKDSDGVDADESTRKKSVQLLGKKILGSLNP